MIHHMVWLCAVWSLIEDVIPGLQILLQLSERVQPEQWFPLAFESSISWGWNQYGFLALMKGCTV